MAYGKSIDLIKRTQLDKVLRGQAFRIESDPKYNGYQRKLALMVYELIDKKSSGVAAIESNYQLANKLHKEVIRKFKKRKVYSWFRDNIWGVDLADTQSLRKCNKVIKYLLCAIGLFSYYVWVVPLKDKSGITIVNAFQKKISEGCKANKIWVDQGGEFYNKLFKRFLKINNIEMYSTYNEGNQLLLKDLLGR